MSKTGLKMPDFKVEVKTEANEESKTLKKLLRTDTVTIKEAKKEFEKVIINY